MVSYDIRYRKPIIGCKIPAGYPGHCSNPYGTSYSEKKSVNVPDDPGHLATMLLVEGEGHFYVPPPLLLVGVLIETEKQKN